MRVDARRRAHLSQPALGVHYAQAPVSEDTEWQLRGLCRTGGYDPNLFFPFSEEDAVKAKQICGICPMIAQCAQWALAKRENYGVWGGLSEADRQHLWTGRPPRLRYHKVVAAPLSEVVRQALDGPSDPRPSSRRRVT